MTALWPIDIEFPQLRITLRVDAEFTNALPVGTNGLLGNMGFFDRFTSVCFHARARSFSIDA
ncbi:MAG: hypothetical protein IPK00_25830 [Deltaproteobacteria bacterium]|nr:hypothetical protein [Deltaproteobacteria bacterium]